MRVPSARSPRNRNRPPPATSSRSPPCCSMSSSAAVTSTPKLPLRRQAKSAAWCAGSILRTGIRRSFWGFSGRCCGRSVKGQGDVDGLILLVHIHDSLGVAEIVEKPALLDLRQEKVRIVGVIGLSQLQRPEL